MSSILDTGAYPIPPIVGPSPDLSKIAFKSRYIAVDTTSGDIMEFDTLGAVTDFIEGEVRYPGVAYCRVFSVQDEFDVDVETTHKVTLKRVTRSR